MTRLFSLLLFALVARFESPAGLGRYALVVAVLALAAGFSDLGLSTYLVREAAAEEEDRDKQQIFNRVLALKLGLALLAYGLLLLISQVTLIPRLTAQLIMLGGLVLLPEAASGAMAAYLNARQRMEISAVILVLGRGLSLLGALLVLQSGYGLPGVLAAAIGASLAGTILYIAVLLRWRVRFSFRFQRLDWRHDLRQALPFALTSLIALVYLRVDLLLLGLWRGESAAGWYSGAYRLWESIRVLPNSLLNAGFPELSRRWQQPAQGRSLSDWFQLGMWGLLGVGLLLTLLLQILAEPLLGLIFGVGEVYTPALAVFRLLAWSIPAVFLYLYSGYLLYAAGQQALVMRWMLVIALLNVTLNLFAIPRWGLLGAGAVALLSEWLLAAMLYPRARRALALRRKAFSFGSG